MSLHYHKKVLPNAISFVKRELAQRQWKAVIHSSASDSPNVKEQWLSPGAPTATSPQFPPISAH